MPKKKTCEVPLPVGWDEGQDYDGKTYYIDHTNKRTSWIDPRDKLTKPMTFADCVGNELPFGWEEVSDQVHGKYFINHNGQTQQTEDPRVQWQQQREEMLRDYLNVAEADLVEKQDMLSVKQKRLSVAENEVQFWKTELERVEGHQERAKHTKQSSMSSSSSNSTVGSITSRYDPNQLKKEITQAKSRVDRLKAEMAHVTGEVQAKEQGVRTLESVDRQLSASGVCNTEDVSVLLEEMKKSQGNIVLKEREREEFIQTLVKLRENLSTKESSEVQESPLTTRSLTRDQPENSDVPSELPRGRQELRSELKDARRRQQRLQSDIAMLEERLRQAQTDDRGSKAVLLEEKEALLEELGRLDSLFQSEDKKQKLELEKQKLAADLDSARQLSHRVIADRIQLQTEKSMLVQQLAGQTKLTNLLEAQLRNLSTSTLSISSCSSRGSLSLSGSRGSLSASSRGSLSSLNYHDGGHAASSEPLNFRELHQKITDMLQGMSRDASCQPIYEARSTGVSTSYVPTSGSSCQYTGPSSSSQISLSSRDSFSMSSMSPPISPSTSDHSPTASAASRVPVPHADGDTCLEGGDSERNSSAQTDVIPVQQRLRVLCGDSRSSESINSFVPLSPITEGIASPSLRSGAGPLPHPGMRPVTAAPSDESVAADSGVFDAFQENAKAKTFEGCQAAQIKVGLSYDVERSALAVCIDQARGLERMGTANSAVVYVKAMLLSNAPNEGCVLETRLSNDVNNPVYGERFHIPIEEASVFGKTLQINIWSLNKCKKEEFLGGTQISLAEFKSQSPVQLRWYNLLSSTFFQSAAAKCSHGKTAAGSGIQELAASGALGTDGQAAQGRALPRPSSWCEGSTSGLEPSVAFGRLPYRSVSQEVVNEAGEGVARHVAPKPAPGRRVERKQSQEDSVISGGSLQDRDSDFDRPPPARYTKASLARSKYGRKFSDPQPMLPLSFEDMQFPALPAPVLYDINLNRSNSDCTTRKTDRSPFVRLSVERSSMRRKRPVSWQGMQYQMLQSAAAEAFRARLCLDHDFDSDSSRTRKAQVSELQQLKQKIEEAIEGGSTNVTKWLEENEQYRLLVRELERDTLRTYGYRGNRVLSRRSSKQSDVKPRRDKAPLNAVARAPRATDDDPEAHWV